MRKMILCKRPLLLSALFVAAGIISGHLLHPAPSICFFLTVLGSISAWVSSRRFLVWPTILVWAAELFLGAGIISYSECSLPCNHIALFPPEEEVAIVGKIIEAPIFYENICRFVLDLRGIETGQNLIEPVGGKVQITVSDEMPVINLREKLEYGTWVRLETKLETPRGFMNPGYFNPAEFLEIRGIYFTGTVKYTEFLTVLKPASHYHPLYWIYRIKRFLITLLETEATPWFQRRFTRAGITTDEIRSLSKALLVGDRSSLSDTMKRTFQLSGLYHILAISGLHVGIVTILLFNLFGYIFSDYKIQAAASASGVILYGLIAGGSASVSRAVLLSVLFLGSKLLDRRADILNILGAAALILLLFNPRSLFDIGFQLTFAATFGIIIFMPVWNKFSISRKPNKLLTVILVSISAQAATAPLSAYYFNRIGGWAFLPYLALIPVVTLALASGLAGLFLSFLPWFGHYASILFLKAHATLLALLIKLVSIISHWPGITIPVRTPDTAELGLLIFMLILFALGSYSLRFTFFIPVLILAAGTLQYIVKPLSRQGKLSVFFIDVGNADSTLIRCPSDDNFLIDGGGIFGSDYDIGRKIVVRTLRTLGVNHLNALIITHPHPDHQLGVISILEEISVDHIWVPDRKFRDVDFKKILRKAETSEIPVLELDDRSIFHHLHLNWNNRSLVFAVQFGNCRILLPGDAEKEAEAGLCYLKDNLKSVVLKAGHHGSRTSSTTAFLDAVRPSIVFIPCGRKNRFGHPHREALQRIAACQSKPMVFRADENGMMRVETDGELLTVSVFKR